MKDIEYLQHWAKIGGLSYNVRDYSDLIGYFQVFRPNGAGVEAVFEGITHGDAMLKRIMDCYKATTDNYDDSDAYFIPRPKTKCEPAEAETLLRSHFSELSKMASIMDFGRLVDMFETIQLQQVEPSKLKEERLNVWSPPYDGPDAYLYDMICDYTTTFEGEDSPLDLLRDAIYSMANDVQLRLFIMWPLYAKYTDLADPMKNYFELWKRGVEYVFPDDEVCFYSV